MPLTQQKDVEKIIIEPLKNSITVKVKEYLLDEQGNKFVAEGKENGTQCAFMPGQTQKLQEFTGRAVGPEHDAASSMWTPEVVDAHNIRIGKMDADLLDKPQNEWTAEDKARFNANVAEKYRVQ